MARIERELSIDGEQFVRDYAGFKAMSERRACKVVGCIGWLAPAVYAAQFGSQWAKALRLVGGHAPWPIARSDQMEKITARTQLASG